MLRIGGKGKCSTLVGTDEVSYPKGLRVMAIDSNPVSLLILVTMLRRCQYEVTAQAKATEALETLRRNRREFDIVVTAMVGLDMDGFVLLKVIVSKLDIPVIIASASDDQQVIMRSVLHGARDFLLKPVRVQVLQNIWQHVVRKQLEEREDNRCANNDDSSKIRKRFDWTAELHARFINAIQQLGVDSANPKRIVSIMKAEGLTTEHVKSRLRTYKRKLMGHHAAPNQGSQRKDVSGVDTKHRHYYNTHGVRGTEPPLNQVSNYAIDPLSINWPVLQDYRPHAQQPENQIGSHSEYSHLDALQDYRPMVQRPEGQKRSSAESSSTGMGSSFGGMSVDHPHVFPGNSRGSSFGDQITYDQNRVKNLSPVGTSEGNNAFPEQKLIEEPGGGRDMYYCESSYHDDELAVMIDQFNVDKAPRL